MNSSGPPAGWEPGAAASPAAAGSPLPSAVGVAGPSTPVSAAPPPLPIPGDTDLPAELVADGWRRLWSRRENRHYFWNHRTNESLWELPTAHGRQQPSCAQTPA
ncbi:mRNA (2'-O-methyladenosine-N(6)-)-methyltransferase-like [Pollicipes pollicipes]|uniref:mRNA (2'-O-methyladenosine-N(6)-)-methyltransferase-like n=1 Tax=Pollicipes pollicipes TaxID=41117 RepID=UPI0018850EC1|nr:mRNA (2'-O-methyladenosine-N(6)-)-methyltransferase-like [Pollicipes pollicipes]